MREKGAEKKEFENRLCLREENPPPLKGFPSLAAWASSIAKQYDQPKNPPPLTRSPSFKKEAGRRLYGGRTEAIRRQDGGEARCKL